MLISRICPHCSFDNQLEAETTYFFCQKCGRRLKVLRKPNPLLQNYKIKSKCPKCSFENTVAPGTDSFYCQACGTKLRSKESLSPLERAERDKAEKKRIKKEVAKIIGIASGIVGILGCVLFIIGLSQGTGLSILGFILEAVSLLAIKICLIMRADKVTWWIDF